MSQFRNGKIFGQLRGPPISSSCFCSFRAFLLLQRRPKPSSSDHSVTSSSGNTSTGRAGHCLGKQSHPLYCTWWIAKPTMGYESITVNPGLIK